MKWIASLGHEVLQNINIFLFSNILKKYFNIY
jgi:hypothetical protein